MLWIVLLVALIVLGGLAGGALGFAPAWLAVPVGLLALPFAVRAARPEGQAHGADEPGEEEPERNRLGARRQEFTERDRSTLAP